MTGQMPDIINRIDALKYKAWALLGKEPNTIYMNIADYRRFCEETADMWIVGADKINYGKGELMARSDAKPRPTQIMLMRIVKRSGEMECAFDEAIASSEADNPTLEPENCVHGNDFTTCAKCIPPITKREFSGVPDTIKISMVNIAPLAEWFRNQAAKEFEKLRFKFEQRMPDIGECGLVMIDNQTLFVTRTSQNYFHSYGNPSSGSTQILIERAKEAVTDAVTLVRVDPSIEGDESVK